MKPPEIRVCHFSSVHPPADNRIFFKQCVSLAKAGYHVTLIVKDDLPPRTERSVRVVPFPPCKNRWKRLLVAFPKMLRLTLKQHADICHFHDPELIPVAIILKLLGKKVIYDVHEDAPLQILSKEWITSPALRRLSSRLTWLFEKTGELFFDAIVAATPDIAKKFKAAKTITIHNYPILGHISAVPAISPDPPPDKPVVIYAGKIALHRGVRELVDAAAMVKTPIELWLLGKYERQEYFDALRQSPGWAFTRYFGLQSPETVYSYMKAAHIGVSTLYPIPNYLESLPVKAFEYMACGLPIIMSPFPFWRKLFGECALFADPLSAPEIAERIDSLTADPALRERLAEKGRAVVLEKCWENDEALLLQLYKKLSLPREVSP